MIFKLIGLIISLATLVASFITWWQSHLCIIDLPSASDNGWGVFRRRHFWLRQQNI